MKDIEITRTFISHRMTTSSYFISAQDGLVPIHLIGTRVSSKTRLEGQMVRTPRGVAFNGE